MPTREFELTGLDHLLANLARLGTGASKACAPALEEEAKRIMNDSKDIVPYEDGDLQESGKVGDAEISNGLVSVEMGYGSGPSAPYAVVQHERLDLEHPGGKRGKYLEEPLMAAERGMGERLAPDIESELEKLVK